MLVRTDIALEQQIVQVGHACLEAGRRFDWPDTPCNLVVLGVANVSDLRAAIERVQLAEVRVALFYEPDHQLGLTAACTEPISGAFRRLFRRFALWNGQDVIFIRGPPHPVFRKSQLTNVCSMDWSYMRRS